MKRTVYCALLLVVLGMTVKAEDPVFEQKTLAVPRVQAVPMPDSRTSFQLDGHELTACHYSEANRRVFWYPVKTSFDRSLTRMGHPHDPLTHSHHNSVWIAHADVDGVTFWGDQGKKTGQIKNVAIPRNAYSDNDESASMLMVNHWVSDVDSKVMLIETRRTVIIPLDGVKSWMMIVDVSFSVPGKEAVAFNPTPFGLIAVRMAKSIGVHDGGGRILNSEGAINEKDVFRKPARWCDYSGRLTNDRRGFAGITLMNHTINPEHPTPFHVRDDGWMGACLNLESKVEVRPDKPLRFRYGLWMHDEIASQSQCEAIWRQFDEMSLASLAIEK
jgi:Methane oxygenase PmoA